MFKNIDPHTRTKSNSTKFAVKSDKSLFGVGVDPIIKKILVQSVDPKFHPLVLHQVSTGGKRLRPNLAIISCQLLEGKLADVLYPAAGLEILHNYTLIIDDIIDSSVLRRNKPTLWAQYGRSIAQCAAIDFSASIFQTARHSPRPIEITEIFVSTLKKIIDGEITDILFERAGRNNEAYIVKARPKTITQNQYIQMIGKKTSSLFEASCEVGALCAGAENKQIKHLKTYGFNLGMAFQIKDDLLDIFGEEKKFGKKIGKDIQERKGGNIVLLYAMQKSSNVLTLDVKTLKNILKKERITRKDIQRAMQIINTTNARDKAILLGQSFIKKAKTALKPLPQNKYTKSLETIADFVIKREK